MHTHACYLRSRAHGSPCGPLADSQGSITNPPTPQACKLNLKVACSWFAFGVLEGFGTNAWVPSTLMAPCGTSAAVPECKHVAELYYDSLFHSLGLITGVYASGGPATAVCDIHAHMAKHVGHAGGGAAGHAP